jgi:2-methylcitrate dehydratase
MTSIPLIFGRLSTNDYTDEVAKDPRIDALRAKVRIALSDTCPSNVYRN